MQLFWDDAGHAWQLWVFCITDLHSVDWVRRWPKKSSSDLPLLLLLLVVARVVRTEGGCFWWQYLLFSLIKLCLSCGTMGVVGLHGATWCLHTSTDGIRKQNRNYFLSLSVWSFLFCSIFLKFLFELNGKIGFGKLFLCID